MHYLRNFLLILLITTLSYSVSIAGWTAYNLDNDFLYSDQINTLHADTAGFVWIGDANNGILKTDEIDWTPYSATFSHLVDDRMTDINSDHAGNIWAGTLFGVSRFDGFDDWYPYNSDSGLPHINIRAIDFGFDGYIYYGTWAAGLTKFDGDTTYTHFSTDSGLVDNRIMRLWPVDSGLWIATQGGLSFMGYNKVWHNYTMANSGLAGDNIQSMVIDAVGNLWLGTESGVNRFSTDSVWTTYTTLNGLAPGEISAMAIDSSGNLWFGHSATDAQAVYVTRFDGLSEWTVFDIGNPFFGSFVSVTDIAVDRAGQVWVATEGEGISVYDDESTDIIDPENKLLPVNFTLFQNYPNPFNAGTNIEFDLAEKASVSLAIFNGLGQEVDILADRQMEAGQHSIIWNAINRSGVPAPSGVYFYRLKVNNLTESKIMVLMK